jgi:hypothetical protein
MTKKPNPWVAALQKKKSAVDLHPDVLRAVLKMNPGMRGGDRSTEEVGQALMADLPTISGGPQPEQVPESRFRRVFGDMLTEFQQMYNKERVALDERKKQIEREEQSLRQSYLDRVAEFLAEVQPGPMTEGAREVLLENIELVRALKVEISDINRRVREMSAAYKKQ